jgi:S1-C subfamily serine protease
MTRLAPTGARQALARRLPAALLCTWAGCATVAAATLAPAVQQSVGSATFEVVLAKPAEDPLTYEKPLPLELLPFRERNDKFRSIGTAFAIGPDRFVSAAHVFDAGVGSQYGPLALRDAAGRTYPVDQILKFSNARDFVVFSVRDAPTVVPLEARVHPTLNQPVFAVGNAFGEGVVIRDGLYTSDSPEEMDGRWQWLRFSAAASPGNSGGPLVDRDGKVIGIVLRKSPNENLNFALPIGIALDAPADAAAIEARATYRIAVSKTSDTFKFEERLPLPRGVADFLADELALLTRQLAKTHADFFERHGANLFPFGEHSQELLHSVHAAVFPRMISESDSGIWGVSGDNPQKTQLDHNGYVQAANTVVSGMTFGVARLRVPDDVQPETLVEDSKQFMDLVLKAVPLQRTIGSDAVRVTSLGRAREDSWLTDYFGRRWQVRAWFIPFSDTVMLTLAMPTPDGFVFIMAQVPTGIHSFMATEIGQLTRFMYVSFEGTLRQWKEFLGHPSAHPEILSRLALQFDYGRGFGFKSPRFQMLVPAGVQAIGPDSVLDLGFSFFLDGDRPVWDVGAVRLADDQQGKQYVAVQREARPTGSLPDSFANHWRDVATGVAPFDGTPRSVNGRTEIMALVDAKEVAAGRSSVGYTIAVNADGLQKPAHMKGALDTLRRGVTVFEH